MGQIIKTTQHKGFVAFKWTSNGKVHKLQTIFPVREFGHMVGCEAHWENGNIRIHLSDGSHPLLMTCAMKEV